MDLSAFKVRRDEDEEYYISNLNPNCKYLHSDGRVLELTCNEQGVYTGLYSDRACAEVVLNKYKPKPKVTTKDLKPGDKFICNDHERGIMCVACDYQYLPLYNKWCSDISVACVYVHEQDPYTLHWFTNVQEVEIVSRKGD